MDTTTRTAAAVAPDRHVAVLASAGTGKTYLLVTRLLRLLLADARPDAILALTFTRKAAAEMQTRLNERLHALAGADAAQLDAQLRALGLTPDATLRARAAGLYESLLLGLRAPRITTFHAFCQELLRRFPLEADIAPGFELSETTGELMAQAWAALFAEATAAPDGTLAQQLDALLDATGSIDSLRTALLGFLQLRSEWWAFSEDCTALWPELDARLAAHFAVDADTDLLTPFFNDLTRQALREFAALLRRHPTVTHLRQAEAIDAGLSADDPADTLRHIRHTFFTGKGEVRARSVNQTLEKKLGAEGMVRFLNLHARLAEQLQDLDDARKRQANLHLHRLWYRVGTHLLAHFQRLKREQRLLDFADLEWHGYRLLSRSQHAHWVQYKLDQRIDHLLIDEFQDTNPTQWRLLYPLLEELTAGDPERTRSVFLVGDAKQSIYGFRRAEPRLLGTAAAWLRDRGGLGVPLDASWRSAPAVIEAVNRVFSDAPLREIITDFPVHATHRSELWGRVEILPLQAIPASADDADTAPISLRDPLRTPRVVDEEQRHYLEGRQIADRILALRAQGVCIGHGATARPLEFDDIIILLRARTHIDAYERALRDAGIPYLGADRGTLLSCLEVRDLLQLLNTLIAPFDNLALAQVLRSPLFAASDVELAELAGHGEWWSRLARRVEEPDCPTTLARAQRWLTRWRDLAGELPVHDLLDRIYSEGNVPARYEAAFPPALRTRVRANLTRLIELALEIDSGRYPSLAHFLTRLHSLRGDSQEAPDEGRGAPGARVTLMTIHAAKGLEAPVVFLADSASGKPGGGHQGARTLVDWPPQAPRPRHLLLAGTKDRIDSATQRVVDQLAEAAAREDANLLYVALTRARQLLILSAIPDKRTGDAQGWYGTIRQALAPHMTETGDGTLYLTSGTPPVAGTGNTSSGGTDLTVDPRLAERIDLSAHPRLIAPSREDEMASAEWVMGDEDGRLRGVVLHRCLQLLSDDPHADRVAGCRRVAAEFALDSADTRLATWWDEAAALVTGPAWRDWLMPQTHEAHNELAVLYGAGPHTVHGILDRVLVRHDAVLIIDYKTHQGAERDKLPALAEGYRRQLHWYRQGAERLWPDKPVRCLLLFTACALAYDLDTKRILDNSTDLEATV